VVSLGIVGLEFEGEAEFYLGTGQVAAFGEDAAQVVVGQDVVGLEFNGPAEPSLGSGRIATLKEGEAKK